MIRFIDEVQINKAPIQAMVNSIAFIFVPVIMVISTLTFVCWLLFNNGECARERGFVALMSDINAVVVVYVCALGLDTTTTTMLDTWVGALNGLLIKCGAVLEVVYSIDTFIHDKTENYDGTGSAW